MAYFLRSDLGSVSTSSTTFTLNVPSSSQNQLVILSLSINGGGTVSSIVGNNSGTWTQQVNQAGLDELWVWTCVQSATPDTSVTITFDATELISYVFSVFGGVDTTTPVIVSNQTSNSKTPTAPSVTTTKANSLIFYTGNANGRDIFAPEGMYLLNNANEAGRSSVFTSYTYANAIGATGTRDFYLAHDSAYTCVMVTIAINDDGTGDFDGYHDTTSRAFEYLNLMSRGGGIFSDGTTYDPTSASFENISSISNGSYTNSTTLAHPVNAAVTSGLEPQFSTRGFSINSSLNIKDAAFTGLPITKTDGIVDNYDLSGEILIVNTKMDGGNVTTESEIGSAFGISDKTNAKFWQLSTVNSSPSIYAGLYPALIDVDDATFVMDTVGTPNTANIGALIICSESTKTASPVYVAPVSIMRTLKIQGGSAGRPASFSTMYDIAKKGLLNTVLAQGGLANNQYFVAHDSQCGGTETVYWDSSNEAIEWPSEYSAANAQRSFKIGAGKLAHTIAPATGSTVTYDSTTLNFGNFHNFVLNSPNVSISSEGLNVLNSDVTLTAHSGALSGISFIGCKEINNSCDLSGGNTISNCVDTYAITVTSEAEFNNLQNCDFSGNNYSIRITGNHGGQTWSATGMTVAGGTGSYDIRYEGAGTLTIEVEVGSGWSQVRSEATVGTLTISAPTITLTVNSDVASSDIKIFETGTQTIEASATGTTASTTTAGTYDITVMKAGYLPQRQTGVTLGTSNVTVDISLVADPIYSSSHGLTYTTDFSYNRATKKLTLSTRQEGRDFYSALIDNFISQSSLDNTAFDFQAVGPDSIFFLNGAEIVDSASEDNWKGAGIRYLNSSDVVTAEWCSIKSSGTIPAGATGEYQQVDGSGTTDLRATGAVDQIIQIYGDATHGNFNYRDHLVIKYQVNGYRETRSDVLSLAGIAALEPFEYSLAIEPVAISAATGDPAITLTVTDHGASPVTWNGKQFSVTVQYSGADSGEDILRELNYNLSLDTTYQGKDPFNWPEMVLEAGGAYETARGITEGGTGATLKGVRVVNASGDPHPDLTRFQADDGTYYVVPVTANGSITSIVSGSRVRIYNETTATETYNDIPGTSYAVSYTEGTTYTSGDVIKIYITQTSGTTAKLPFTTTVVASSTGWSALADQQDDTVYNQYGLNGSTISKFTADYVNDEVDLAVASNFAGDELYAWWAYNLTTLQGISDFFGGLTAQDAANLLINDSVVSIFLDNTTTTNVYQTDNIRVYRDDGAYPVKNPTTGGGGIDVVWRDRVYIAETGTSGLTPTESAQLGEISSVNTKIGSPVVTVSADIATVDSIVDAILVDTGTTIPAQISGLNDLSAAQVNAECDTAISDANLAKAVSLATVDSNVDAVKAKTDQLVFTKANEVDVNIQSVNDVTVSGTGSEGDEWRPV